MAFGVPTWELLLSATLLIAAFVFFTWLSAKIYRVGILMYGYIPSIFICLLISVMFESQLIFEKELMRSRLFRFKNRDDDSSMTGDV